MLAVSVLLQKNPVHIQTSAIQTIF
jgi:hypothetical protein